MCVYYTTTKSKYRETIESWPLSMHQKRLEKKEKIRFKRKSVFEFFFDREIFKNKFSSILKKKKKKHLTRS